MDIQYAATKPIGDNILIRLPNYQKERERKTGSGLYVMHLEGFFEHDTSRGEVVAVGDQAEHCKVGDTVFFSRLCIQNGLQNSGLDKVQSDNTRGRDNGVPVRYVVDNEGHYLFMPESRMYLLAEDISGTQEMELHGGVICLLRGGVVHCLNTYHIIKDAYDKGEVIDGVVAKRQGSILVVQPKEQAEMEKRFEVLYAPDGSELSEGDIILTKPHCDIKLEGDFNYPQLPKGCYFVRGADILCEVGDGVDKPAALKCAEKYGYGGGMTITEGFLGKK